MTSNDEFTHINLHEYGTDRMTPSQGVTLYVDNGLKHIDTTGSIRTMLGVEGGTTAVSPGFGNWTTADSARPVWLEIDTIVETDGTSRGEIVIDVDESGGTTADYTLTLAHIAPDNASGTQDKALSKVYIPAGAQYQIRNVSDPNAANTLDNVRAVTA